MNLDEYQTKLGGVSFYEIKTFTFVLIVALGPGFCGQFAVFLSATPTFRCDLPVDFPVQNLTEEEILNLTVPYSIAKQDYERCKQFNMTSWSNDIDRSDVIKCPCGFVYDDQFYESTAVTEFDLVCDRAYLDTIVNSLYCLGCFFGSMACGPLCDWFGRRQALLVFSLLYTVFGVAVALSPNYLAFATLRTLSAGADIAAYLAAFTYVSEMCPKAYRHSLELICFVSQTFAHLLVPLLGFLLRRWRQVGIVGGLLSAPIIIFYPFIPESPRWLLSKRKYKAARKVIEKVSKSCGKALKDEDWVQISSAGVSNSTDCDDGVRTTVVDLFRGKRCRFVSLIVSQVWCSITLLHYGMIINIGNFVGNPYLNGIANAGIEVLGLLVFLLIPMVGKRRLLSLSFLLGGLACITSALVDIYLKYSALVVGFAVFGKMCVQAAQILNYSVTSQIYPTFARGTGLSLGSMCARVGCAIAPFVIHLQTTIPWFTQVTFGVLGVMTSVTCLFFPDDDVDELMTSHNVQTLEDAEECYAQTLSLRNRLFGKSSAEERRRSKEMELEENEKLNA